MRSKENRENLRIILAFSPGGHYVESMQILDALLGNEVFFVSPYAPTTEDLENVFYITDTAEIGLIRSMIMNTLLSLKILLKTRPDVVVTTGAEIVVPLCYLAKFLFGSRIVFIETFARIVTPSWTGRMIYPIADEFLVQWEDIKRCYGAKAKYVGKVF